MELKFSLIFKIPFSNVIYLKQDISTSWFIVLAIKIIKLVTFFKYLKSSKVSLLLDIINKNIIKDLMIFQYCFRLLQSLAKVDHHSNLILAG